MLAAPSWAQTPLPRRDLGAIHDQFIESLEKEKKAEALEELARTPPLTMQDTKWAFDLFMRFPEVPVRRAVISALNRIESGNVQLEAAFMEYLRLPEGESQVFGIIGALRLRSTRALPVITEIAQRRFRYKDPGDAVTASERNTWWAQYEALSALAQWQGAKQLPLLRNQAMAAPTVAHIMARYLWKDSLPTIADWSRAGGSAAQAAQEAFNTEVPLADLRESYAAMLKLVRSRDADRELRHQLAIKVGLASDDAGAEALLAEHSATRDPDTKLMLAAALFASRNPKTVPWLEAQAQNNADPKTRMGALIQLRDMVPPEKHKSLLEWTAAKDPDEENRQAAADLLKSKTP
jgi:hypothetical protein